MEKDRKLTQREKTLLQSTFNKSVSNQLANQVIEAGDTAKNYIPVSGGNTIPIEMYKNFLNEFKDGSEFLWFLVYQRYFTNLFSLGNANYQERSAFKNYLVALYWFGCGALTKEDNKLYSWGLTPTKSDVNGDITKGNVWAVNLALTNTSIPKDNGKVWPNDNIVYGKRGYNALPTIINLANMIKNIETMLNAFETNIKFSAKKMKYTIRNNDSAIIRQEMEIFNDVKTAIIGEIAPMNDTDIKNIIEELKLNGDNSLLEQIKSYIGLMQTYQGIYSNTNFKKERNISNEFKGDELMTELQIEDQRFQLEKVIEEMNEKFGTNYILEYMIDKLDLEQEEGQPSQQMEEGDENVL